MLPFQRHAYHWTHTQNPDRRNVSWHVLTVLHPFSGHLGSAPPPSSHPPSTPLIPPPTTRTLRTRDLALKTGTGSDCVCVAPGRKSSLFSPGATLLSWHRVTWIQLTNKPMCHWVWGARVFVVWRFAFVFLLSRFRVLCTYLTEMAITLLASFGHFCSSCWLFPYLLVGPAGLERIYFSSSCPSCRDSIIRLPGSLKYLILFIFTPVNRSINTAGNTNSVASRGGSPGYSISTHIYSLCWLHHNIVR